MPAAWLLDVLNNDVLQHTRGQMSVQSVFVCSCARNELYVHPHTGAHSHVHACGVMHADCYFRTITALGIVCRPFMYACETS